MSETPPIDPDTGEPFTAGVARRIAAPKATVWRALTEAALFGRWFMGTWGQASALDPTPGGRYEVRGETPDGVAVACRGEVTAVASAERIELTFEWEGDPETPKSTIPEVWPTTITVALQDAGAETIVALVHAGLAEAGSRDAHAEAWASCLNALADVCSEAPPGAPASAD